MVPVVPKELQIGAKLPNIIGQTQVGVVGVHDYMDGAWGVLCTFPQTHHPVWMTELGMMQKLKDQFDARNCRLLALNIDSVKQQEQFLQDVNETQDVKVNFPVVADENGEISRTLGLVPASAPKHAADLHRLPFGCTIVLDVDLTVRFLSYYPICVGRNFYEVLRAVDAFQLAIFNQVVTPTNWKINEDVFVEPDITSDAAKKLFPQGFHEIKSYFRITASPAINDER
uniref:Thioredoxin domain-containing protein n=1 Tax=Globisporangium ultimum (strain ATCC 200006 / CBS 805.95 / DAOM BR144) TaxID=431595 RepID=K3XAE5_GLOUD